VMPLLQQGGTAAGEHGGACGSLPLCAVLLSGGWPAERCSSQPQRQQDCTAGGAARGLRGTSSQPLTGSRRISRCASAMNGLRCADLLKTPNRKPISPCAL
jgi:hypothetical protein